VPPRARLHAGAYPLSAGEGSRCTINGADGRLVRRGDWFVCEPVKQDAMDARERAYREMVDDLQNAWRKPGGLSPGRLSTRRAP
jgi:hypothetical protein